jgi:hypothetical protein
MSQKDPTAAVTRARGTTAIIKNLKTKKYTKNHVQDLERTAGMMINTNVLSTFTTEMRGHTKEENTSKGEIAISEGEIHMKEA